MSVMLTVARKELLELQANKRVLISIAVFAMLFAWFNSSAFSELQWIFLSTMIGMYASFSLSGEAFNQEKMSGTLETQFCGPWTLAIFGPERYLERSYRRSSYPTLLPLSVWSSS
jgi:hypothetical protein